MKRFETVIKTDEFVGKDFVQVMRTVNSGNFYCIDLKHFDNADGAGYIIIEEYLTVVDTDGDEIELDNRYVIYFDNYECYSSEWWHTEDYSDIYKDL